MYYNSYTITCKTRKYITDLPLSDQVSILGSFKTKVNQQELMRSDSIAYTVHGNRNPCQKLLLGLWRSYIKRN